MTTIRTISQLELTLTEIVGTIFSITGNDTFILTADNGQNFFVDLIDELNTSILGLQVGQSVRLTGFVNIEDNRLNLINTIIINQDGTRPPPPIVGLQTISGTVGFVVDDNQFILNSNGQIYFVNLLDEFNAIALDLQPNQPITISGSVTLENGRIDVNSSSIVDGVNIPTQPPFLPEGEFPPGSIIGNNTPQFIQGTFNSDTIFGLGGNDTIDGQASNDSVFGNSGSDSIVGGTDDDILFGNVGIDTIDGQDGNDSILGNEDNDLLNGGEGNDTIEGNTGSDEIDGGGGDDSLQGNTGSDRILGNVGNDTILGNEESDRLEGGIGNDSIFGNEANDSVFGNEGNDIIFGNRDNDRLEGNSGNDTIRGGRGNDLVDGGFDFDFLLGELGNDELSGGEGEDLIFGGKDDDFLDGGEGNDTLSGDLNDDTIIGQLGNDLIIGAGRESGENEIDFLIGSGGADTFVLGNTNVAFYSFAGSSDYAIISDLNNVENDRIVAFGGDGIVLGPAAVGTDRGTGIFVDGDLIAIVLGVTEFEVQNGLIVI
ncbi:MAG: calcium-binding protein [Okeania sp. SIO3I5]|uniref:calcium-binding protein n=1 Tax=Okeania sp. SIO3I5 TaxID=2607805 RepID=UPI0013B6E115|nr:calcium-binding protein [Okeania sp. SIO3I5]NEQ36978.1 calcium-binding protein [Okeania sp. SIO3I5]